MSEETCVDNIYKNFIEFIGLIDVSVLPQKIRNILDADFLVDIKKIPNFTDTVLELKNKYYSKGLEVACSGPVSPLFFIGNEEIDKKKAKNLVSGNISKNLSPNRKLLRQFMKR
jgi:hypothetical protein